MFDLAWVGVPSAAIGLLLIAFGSRWLLPARQSAVSQLDNPREYSVEMLVEPGSPLIGRSIEAAGLRHLSNMYLAEIERDGQVIPAVAPHELLRAGDRLVFVGIVASVVELQRIRGLIPATEQVLKLELPRPQRSLIEAVVSNDSPLVGKSVRESRFRSVYNAVIIAVARGGQRITKKVGDIVLVPGDTLLLEARPSFAEQQRNSRDFFLVSRIEDSHPFRYERSAVALAILLAMVAAVTVGWLSILKASLLAAGLMIITRCCTSAIARRSVDWSVLITIAAAFGIGRAFAVTGASQAIAHSLTALAGSSPYLNLVAVYVVTVLFSAVINKNAAAILMFPIGAALAHALQLNIMPFAIAIMVGASASFVTPIGYETNLMVYGPGGYRFGDYFRIGLPLNIALSVVALVIIPLVWKF
jgi:di/tricarboxylate transporter